jgi:hypothetical protein
MLRIADYDGEEIERLFRAIPPRLGGGGDEVDVSVD